MILPFLVIYFRDLSFSFFQISVLFTAFSVSMFLFEIPTGAFADVFSRKYSVVLGFLISGICILLMGIFSSFWIFFLLFIILGFGMTLISGAEEAWVIDNLNYYRRKDLHKEFFIKSQSIAYFAGIFSPLVGALIVKSFSIKPLWFVWGFGILFGGLMLFIFGKEKYKPKDVKISQLFNKTVRNSKNGLKYSYNHKIIFYLVLASIFLAMMIMDGDYWQPFLKNLGMPVYALGIVFSIVSAVSMIIPLTARYLDKYKIQNVFIVLIGIRILLLSSVLFLYPNLFILGAGIFIFSSGLMSLRHPLIEPYFQKHLPKKVRATITSVKSMGVQMGMGLSALLFGFLADIIGVQKIIPLTGVFGLVAMYYFYKIRD